MKGALFTYALTVFGVVGGVMSPFVGLLCYICLAIVRPEFMWFWEVGPEGRYSFLVGVSMLVGWGLAGFGKWKFGRATPIVACMIGYWLWMMLSSLQAEDVPRAFALTGFYAKVFLPFLVGLTTIRTMGQVRALLWVILLSQGYVAFELNLYYLNGYNMAREEGFGSMDNNSFAIALVTGVGLAYFLGMATKSWWKKGIALTAALLMAHTILLSFSRGGMLALGLTGAMSFVLIPKRPAHYCAFATAVLLMILLAGEEVRERFASTFGASETGEREASAQSRLDLWKGALDKSVTNPMLGVGPDNWGLYAPEYGWPLNKEVHSLWMQNAAEVGLPGLALLLSIFVITMVKLWPIARGHVPVQDPFERDVARVVIASLFGFLIAAQFVTIKYLEVPYYIVLAGAAVLMFQREARPVWNVGWATPRWRPFRAATRRVTP